MLSCSYASLAMLSLATAIGISCWAMFFSVVAEKLAMPTWARCLLAILLVGAMTAGISFIYEETRRDMAIRRKNKSEKKFNPWFGLIAAALLCCCFSSLIAGAIDGLLQLPVCRMMFWTAAMFFCLTAALEQAMCVLPGPENSTHWLLYTIAATASVFFLRPLVAEITASSTMGWGITAVYAAILLLMMFYTEPIFKCKILNRKLLSLCASQGDTTFRLIFVAAIHALENYRNIVNSPAVIFLPRNRAVRKRKATTVEQSKE